MTTRNSRHHLTIPAGKRLRRLFGATFFATAALTALGAHATVSTYALVGDGTNEVVSGYNVNTQDYQNFYYDPTAGAKRWGGCLVAGVAGCSAAWEGTTTTSPDATSSFDRATYTATAYGTPSTGTAYARGDLTTGQLGVSGDGTARFANGGGNGVLGQARAIMADGLTFTVAGASASTVTDIGVVVDLHGTFLNPNGGSSLTNQLSFGNASYDTFDGLGYGPNTHHTPSGWVSYAFTTDTNNEIRFSGVYALTGAMQHVDLWELLYMQSGNGASIDFGHTSDFSLNLPSNVTFTSDSGAFLTAAPSGGVPEPASWALMIAGLSLVGGTLRRRRQTVPTLAQAAT